LSNVSDTEDNTDTIEQRNRFFIISFIDKLSNIVTSCLNKKLIMVGYINMNRLNNNIKIQKDSTDKEQKCNVVYKINFKDYILR